MHIPVLMKYFYKGTTEFYWNN